MLFAQATNGFNVFDNGVAVGALTLVVAATVYILRRMLNEKNGLFTVYVAKTNDTMESIANTCQQQADTQVKQEQSIVGIKESQARMETSLVEALRKD